MRNGEKALWTGCEGNFSLDNGDDIHGYGVHHGYGVRNKKNIESNKPVPPILVCATIKSSICRPVSSPPVKMAWGAIFDSNAMYSIVPSKNAQQKKVRGTSDSS